MILESEGDIAVVAEAEDGAQAVEIVRRDRPDVVLMDVRMPVLDGIAATSRIVAAELQTRVLVLTTFDLDEVVFEALRAVPPDSSSRPALQTISCGRYVSSPPASRCCHRRSRAASWRSSRAVRQALRRRRWPI